MSTGYSVRPVARAIKTKHAGLNLTGPAGMGGALCIDPEAASKKGIYGKKRFRKYSGFN